MLLFLFSIENKLLRCNNAKLMLFFPSAQPASTKHCLKIKYPLSYALSLLYFLSIFYKRKYSQLPNTVTVVISTENVRQCIYTFLIISHFFAPLLLRIFKWFLLHRSNISVPNCFHKLTIFALISQSLENISSKLNSNPNIGQFYPIYTHWLPPRLFEM